jgi:phage shock protein PspC (stress-responsive transcriptional regulator)
MKKMKYYLEQSAFGVCEYIGDKMGIASSRVRLYFIYLSCGTLGSSLIVYLFMIFWVNIRRYTKTKRDLLRA